MLLSLIQEDIFSFKNFCDNKNISRQRRLTRFNEKRLRPALPSSIWETEIVFEQELQIEEGQFLEKERSNIKSLAENIPKQANAFLNWFEELKQTGPGQNDALFSWLAEQANYSEMCWFLTQEAAGEAGFDDLVALSQVKLPAQAKLELARNYWDEMGRGHKQGMHGLMLAKVIQHLELHPLVEETVWESLALANLMSGLALNRRYAYHSIGALGVVELTAPGRVQLVNEGLKRLNVDSEARQYFELHAQLDIRHSEAWNREVLKSLVEENPKVAQAIGEGALMRLAAGKRCFERYRSEFEI